MLKTVIRIAAILLLALPFLASDASAQKGGGRGGGGGGGAGFGRGGGGGGGVGMRSFSAPRMGGAGIGRIGGPGISRFGGPGIGTRGPGIGSRPTISGTGIARRSIGTGTATRFTGRTFAPASARIVGASPRTFAATRGFTRPGIIRANTLLGSRAITNRALRASIAPTLYRGRFRASYWPWWYGGIAIGWVGPVFWPYAYYDFFDYVFWPYVYDDFWPYAYDDVYFGIYGPYAYSGPGVRIARGNTTSVQSAARRTATICSDQAKGLTDLPIERISQTVRATDEQRALLDELKAATAKSVEILRAACPTELPSIAPGRLAAMQSRLETMLQAVQTVRPALDKFYAALSDEQKARFNAVAPADKAAAAGKDQRDLTRLCGERGPGIADLPIERIAQAVQPTAAQQALLDQLKESSASAADRLKADCPTYQALTPTGRADVMEKRLGTILEAMKIVGPALSSFYDALSDEQKARFNTIESKLPQQG